MCHLGDNLSPDTTKSTAHCSLYKKCPITLVFFTKNLTVRVYVREGGPREPQLFVTPSQGNVTVMIKEKLPCLPNFNNELECNPVLNVFAYEPAVHYKLLQLIIWGETVD